MRQPFEPRVWQPPMIEHVEDHERCAVFAAMGSGKTVATYKALDSLEFVDPGPTLVIAPRLVAASTWPNEVEKYDFLAGTRVVPIVGSADQRRSALRDDKASVYTINPENLPWLIERVGADWPWRKVVWDELTKAKGFRLGGGGTQRAKAFGRVAHSRVDRFVGLTGTPAPNGLKDLWGQLWFIDRGQRLGRTYGAFKDRWFRQGFDGFSLEPLPFAQEQIQAAIKDVCLTIDPADYVSIDEPLVRKVEVDLPSRARGLYRDMERQMFVELMSEGLGLVEVEAVSAAARTMKCLQITSGFLFTDAQATRYEELHNAKLDALEQVLDEANGMPVVVAYHFKPDLARLRKRFPAGKTLDDLGPNVEKEWNSGRHPLLFAHPASMGHGLNLQDAGNILCFYGLWWDLEQHQQIIERIGPLRQLQAGHPRAVYLYYLLVKDTVDEMVFNRLQSKKSVQEILLDAMKEK